MATEDSESDKMVVPLLLSKRVHMVIKLFCVETGITMKEFFEPYSEKLEQEMLVRAAEITEMKRQAELKRLKEEEDQKLASAHPLEVPGQQLEEPITQIH